MGVMCACEKIESEEEMIGRILASLSLSEIDTCSAYDEFLKCIIDNSKLDYFMYHNFLTKITGDNKYSKVQFSYFKNLNKSDDGAKNIKKIGGRYYFIYQRGNNYTKIDCLYKHFNRFYLKPTDFEAEGGSIIDSSTNELGGKISNFYQRCYRM